MVILAVFSFRKLWAEGGEEDYLSPFGKFGLTGRNYPKIAAIPAPARRWTIHSLAWIGYNRRITHLRPISVPERTETARSPTF